VVVFDKKPVYTTTKTSDADGRATLTLETSDSDSVGTYTVNVLINGEVLGTGRLDVTASGGNTGPEGSATATPEGNTGPEGQSTETPTTESTSLVDVTDTLGDTPAEYTFNGQEGDTLIATVSSPVFDVYLELRGPDGTTLASNDDFNGLDAQIGPFSLPTTGTYTLVVSSYSATEDAPVGGEFTLKASSITLQGLSAGAAQTLTFSADTQTYYFSFAGNVGDVIDLTVTGQDQLDTTLTLLDSTGTVLMSDDDSGTGYDPEIYQLSLSATGTYTVVVSTTDTTGTADLLLTQAKAGTLDNGAESVKLTPKLTSRALTYDAQAGETILLHVSVASGDPVDLTITAYQDDVSLMSYSTSHIPDGTVLGFEVPASGQVQIFVSGSNPGAVAVELSVDQ